MKCCRHCGKFKNVAEFSTNYATRDRLSSWCKACHNESSRIRQVRTYVPRSKQDLRCDLCGQDFQGRPGRRYCGQSCAAKANYIGFHYRLSPDGLMRLIERSGGDCEICHRPLDPPASGITGQSLCIDHDHDSGNARGLICTDCNTGLGRFRDDTATLAEAIAYLKRYSEIATAVADECEAGNTSSVCEEQAAELVT